MKATKRQLAARFVDAIGAHPLPELAAGLIAAAAESGYAKRDIPALLGAVEHEIRRRYGAVEVQLATAHELPEATLQELAGQVADRAGAEHYSYKHTVDPALLGGFEAIAGGVAVRDSIRFNLLHNPGVTHG